ncbi:MAG: HIT domain-containing protein [Candidatus Omnitrophica bacterium]|nr:HIT domain-containing protein [Candidatus Omnitrophota bacterium]
MKRLWAPWRISYIQKKKSGRCIFCQAKHSKSGHYLVFKTSLSMCIMNIYPYNNGHLMVAPLRHKGNLRDLKEQELLDLIKAVVKAQSLLDKVLKPEGYNIGINEGQIAGAGIPGHLHVHIVPRWQADTNFMPITADTKVISQSLDQLYKKLRYAQCI